MKSNVDEFRIVAEQDFRSFRRRNIVARLDLNKVAEDHRAFPNLFQFAIDYRRRIEPRQVNWCGLLRRQASSGRWCNRRWRRCLSTCLKPAANSDSNHQESLHKLHEVWTC